MRRLLVIVVFTGGCTNSDPKPASTDANLHTGRLALVYRGDDEAGCEGCSEAVRDVLVRSRYRFDVKFVGPREALHVDDETLAKAELYAQPAGNASVAKGFRYVKSTAPAIRKFVERGGRYLGFCMGGYFAGKDPGFELLPGDTDEWITSAHASVKNEHDAVVDVVWGGEHRWMYFQDGPFFEVDAAAPGVTVLARYASNQKILALVASYGKGKVGVVGAHPEADASWYDLAHLTDPDGLDADLAEQLIDATMRD